MYHYENTVYMFSSVLLYLAVAPSPPPLLSLPPRVCFVSFTRSLLLSLSYRYTLFLSLALSLSVSVAYTRTYHTLTDTCYPTASVFATVL